jgi:hypothetical protein
MTKGSCAVVALAVAAACAASPRLPASPSGPPLLAVRGQVRGGPFSLGRADLQRLPRAGFTARDPTTGRAERLEGISLRGLLSGWLEPAGGADTLLVITAAGVAVPLGPATLQQLDPILADRIDGAPAGLTLAWPNLQRPGLAADPRAASWWARDVVALELVTWDRTWGRTFRAPPGAGDAARRGANQLLLRCAPCHRLGSAGGEAGPPLDGAAGRLGPAGLESALRRHPGWAERTGMELATSGEVSADVAALLAAVEASGGAGALEAEAASEPPSR